ncbi:MAG TPA: ABC transporter permease [Dinghuibacter sp.]|uniref:ABC transporter permease n=1 Tax=Dinghuibacter sp. TaxID=2024697 RepID=UPI002B7A096B|nr:ABC transporter permease [Dinghuibacter sp.]HTJ12982.1 ABC transporter permease [Dinghuibacter sp.]
MLRSYLTIAIRHFRRNTLTSLINIGGLMLGLTTGILICLFVVFAFGFDKFHKDYKAIHLVEMNETFAGTEYTGNRTPAPLGPVLRSEIPGLKNVVRVREEGQTLTRYDDKSLYQHGIYAEPDFFTVMTFPAVEGDPAATLREGSGVVLTQNAARRLFGTDAALGKIVLLNNAHPLKVGAVVRDIPLNSTIQFDVVMPFSLFGPDKADWHNRTVQTWLQLQPGADLETVNRQMTAALLSNTDLKQASLFAYPITRLNLYDNFKDGKPYWGKAYLVLTMAFIAFLTLMIACINFMNLSTAMAERRAREVGVRKVLGASRTVIIGQFLGEAVLLAMAALVLSIGLAYLALPWFAAFAEVPLYGQLGDPWVWVLLVLIGLFTGLVAGSYPALFLSRFHPVKVLQRRRGGLLRKSLVTTQFVISIFLVTSTIVLVRQVHYVENRPLGYEASNLIDVVADGDLPGRFELFKHQVEDIPGVVGVTASTSNLVGVGGAQTGLTWPGKNPDQDFVVSTLWAQYDWTKTTGLTLAEGRDFSPDFGADSSACLINETAVAKMGLREPVPGTTIGGKKVIGVLRDYVFNFSGKSVQPLIVYFSKGNLGHFLIRLTNDGQWKTHLRQIEAVTRTLNPGYPFTFRFVNEEYQQQFSKNFGVEQLADLFTVAAILISCLGLFGLATFLVGQRSKELSIRKVLGASPAGLWLSLSAEMLKPVVLGFVIAAPLAAIALSAALKVSDYHIHLSWWMFAASGAGAVGIALATVSYQGFRAARANPVDALRAE